MSLEEVIIYPEEVSLLQFQSLVNQLDKQVNYRGNEIDNCDGKCNTLNIALAFFLLTHFVLLSLCLFIGYKYIINQL